MKGKEKNTIVSGKRKTAIARAILKVGSGKVTINKKDYQTMEQLRKLQIEEPLRISKNVLGSLKFDIDVSVKGGGVESQIEAARQAIARAILKVSKSEKLKREFIRYDRSLIVADVRRKEPNKPGDSKARTRRQKSYR
ncbi:MAG: 30S ribosomal protein S9 [Nanoarchaeota archaeon]|nr:30S ribosomal protein S9 [Nanoarchaeota archaeon]